LSKSNKIKLVWVSKFRELISKHGTNNLSAVFDEFAVYCEKMEGSVNDRWKKRQEEWSMAGAKKN
jgi:hypothetical protein